MAAFENKFEALVEKVRQEIRNQNIYIDSFKETDDEGKLKNSVPTGIIQTDDILDYLILLNFYNDNIDEYSALTDEKKAIYDRKFTLYQVGYKKMGIQCSNGTFPFSDLVSEYHNPDEDTKNLNEQIQSCEDLKQQGSDVTFKEIHEFVTSESDEKAGGKPKSNKKRKTNKRKKTKRRKTNKRKKTNKIGRAHV